MTQGRIVVVGGGRWAGEIGSTLRRLLPADESIGVLSPSNPDFWLEFIAHDNSFLRAASLDAILRDPAIEMVFVARAAQDHVPTARALLQAGKSVFVEKPFALSMAEATSVVEAVRPGRVCMTGLVFLHAQSLLNFASSSRQLGKLTALHIQWTDPAADIRRGRPKRYDQSISVAQDVFPHIWSIFRLFDTRASLTLRDANIAGHGNAATLRFSMGTAEASVSLGRDSDARRRIVNVESAGGTALLDFTHEPGEAWKNDERFEVGEGHTSPLARELSHFIAAHQGEEDPGLADIRHAIEAVGLAEQCEILASRG
jgi:predicted dehydrogenase